MSIQNGKISESGRAILPNIGVYINQIQNYQFSPQNMQNVKPHEAIKMLQMLRDEVVQGIKAGDESKIEQFRARFQQITGKLPR